MYNVSQNKMVSRQEVPRTFVPRFRYSRIRVTRFV